MQRSVIHRVAVLSFASISRSVTGLVAAALMLSIAAAAAASSRALPPTQLAAARTATPDALVDEARMPAVDVPSLLAEDAALTASGIVHRPRFAATLPVALDPSSAGTWDTLDDGSRLWRLRVASPGALSLNLGLSRFDLPPGGTLWIRDPDGGQVQGPYTTRDRNRSGGLWTPVVLGDALVLELLLPPGSDAGVALEITAVNHGYRGFGEPAGEGGAKQGSCNIDVVCPEGNPWRRQIRSVARISVLGAYWCSATLLNNTAQDDTPLLLTANHCIETAGEAHTLVAYWNYESPVCGMLGGGRPTDNQVGAELLATWAYQTGSDFTLLELDDVPDETFGVYYSGWDATGDVSQASVGIHHPNADEKAISFDNDPLTPVDHYGWGDHQWRVEAWDLGTTEGGSSGSCLFEAASGLCVGTLTAGTASCSNPDGYDIYGRFDVHWSGAGSASNRLSDWLDPIGSGARVLLGKEPEAGPAGHIWLIPAAASSPGAEGSNWRSEVVVINPTSEPRTVSLHYVAQATSWPGVPLLDAPLPLPAGQTLYLQDPLAALNPTSGMLYAEVDGTGVVVSSRTYNLDPQGATFGQGIPAVELDGLQAPSELILPLIHSVPGSFRANLGLVQTSAGSFTVLVTAHSPGGSALASKMITVSSGFRQINDIFRELGIPSAVVKGGWLAVELVGPAPQYWTCYASVVDDRTNDPTYVLPVRR